MWFLIILWKVIENTLTMIFDLMDRFHLTKIIKFLFFKTVAILVSLGLSIIVYYAFYSFMIPTMNQDI